MIFGDLMGDMGGMGIMGVMRTQLGRGVFECGGTLMDTASSLFLQEIGGDYNTIRYDFMH